MSKLSKLMEAARPTMRALYYATRFTQTAVQLVGVKPGTPKALRMAREGIQIGIVVFPLGRSFWSIRDLRREFRNAEPVMFPLRNIRASTNEEQISLGGSGMDSIRVENADVSYPIFITPCGVIIDGNHRYQKATELGLTELPVHIVDYAHVDTFGM